MAHSSFQASPDLSRCLYATAHSPGPSGSRRGLDAREYIDALVTRELLSDLSTRELLDDLTERLERRDPNDTYGRCTKCKNTVYEKMYDEQATSPHRPSALRHHPAQNKSSRARSYPPRKTIAKSLIDGDGVGNADVDQRPAWATAMMETIERSNTTFEAGIRSVNARIDGVNAKIDGVNTRIDGVHTRLTRLQGTIDSTRTLVIKSLQASAKASNRLVGFGTLENPLQAVVFHNGENPVDDVRLPPLVTSKRPTGFD
ncbi:hypothetical protein DFP72DRAFT_1064012 [Ephemerocybe angulata]|uniref:Uncharacterized protein n=1 Tax=Ephemerocybe angulata TaxID=980116 RepID=A0A8H6I8C0_9AGAR|nr:hypothetical protein DFP72DRAFT_1064012 [Tulosesus angulatus]